MQFSKKKLLYSVAVISVLAVVLVWPAATWLECRERKYDAENLPDAVYLVAGAKDQNRRIERLVDLYISLLMRTNSQIPIILVGNDRLKGRWSSVAQTNLTAGEWAIKHIDEKLQPMIKAEKHKLRFEIVPGVISGTDSEMKVLAQYLGEHAGLRELVVVTSPFHVRRTVERLNRYLVCPVGIHAATARNKWNDRAPWTVLSELFKMIRDRFFYR